MVRVTGRRRGTEAAVRHPWGWQRETQRLLPWLLLWLLSWETAVAVGRLAFLEVQMKGRRVVEVQQRCHWIETSACR